MNNKKLILKLILAASFCLAASLFTYFNTDISAEKPEVKALVLKKTKLPDKLAIAKKTQNSTESEIILHEHKVETPQTNNDPYQELLLKISNSEFIFPEEQKLESLRQYLETTVSGSSLENAPQSISVNEDEDVSQQAQRTEE